MSLERSQPQSHSAGSSSSYFTLSRSENQARGLAEYAIEFVHGKFGPVDDSVYDRLELFHVDSIGCGVGALCRGMNAPRVLRAEAMEYPLAQNGAYCLASSNPVRPEKAVLANASAVRELDANGTNFGYNERTGQTAGEFGHHDFYPVAVAGAQVANHDGATTARAMLCIDEIRGRLAEAFSLKDHKIDHVVHGGVASAAVYGALCGASVDQIESSIGQFVAHYMPFRAIRAGTQLSDSKGASAAISAEVAIQAVHRSMRGFVGPQDVFRNPQAIFCLFEPPTKKNQSPFDLELATAGSDFAIMGMHFKLGLYEHQSAGAIEAMIGLLQAHPELTANGNGIAKLKILIYEPAFGIIGDPAKRDPRTRQSADHSMFYIIATLWRKAIQTQAASWESLMLMPEDYSEAALFDPLTRLLMDRIEFQHGGKEFDARYPKGIPTQVEIVKEDGEAIGTDLVMYPLGHARNESEDLTLQLKTKFERLVEPACDSPAELWDRFMGTRELSATEIVQWYNFACNQDGWL